MVLFGPNLVHPGTTALFAFPARGPGRQRRSQAEGPLPATQLFYYGAIPVCCRQVPALRLCLSSFTNHAFRFRSARYLTGICGPVRSSALCRRGRTFGSWTERAESPTAARFAFGFGEGPRASTGRFVTRLSSAIGSFATSRSRVLSPAGLMTTSSCPPKTVLRKSAPFCATGLAGRRRWATRPRSLRSLSLSANCAVSFRSGCNAFAMICRDTPLTVVRRLRWRLRGQAAWLVRRSAIF